MNHLTQILESSRDIKQYTQKYFGYLFKLLNELDADTIGAFANALEEARQDGNTIFFIGNGGSAATASHMVNDFGTDIAKRTKTNKPFRVLSLTDNASVMLAVANDSGYDNIFLNQLKIHYRSKDKLVAISASGNSPNVVKAAEWVKNKGGTIMSLVGFDGGRLKGISDVCIHVKAMKEEYGFVEDVHMIMDHLLVNWLQYRVQIKEQKANARSIEGASL